MAHNQMPKTARIETTQQFCGLMITEMSPGTGYPPFERGRIWTLREKQRIVIGFQQQAVTTAVSCQELVVETAEIREYAQTARTVTKNILHGLPRIMRDCNRQNLHSTYVKCIACTDQTHIRHIAIVTR